MKTALISVFNKSKILEFSKFLIKKNYQIISTSGTFKFLHENGIKSIEIKNITQFPEILNGRVKTLHPNIHGGILAKRKNIEHIKTINKYKIHLIDIVIVNLYPFFEKIHTELSLEEKIEFVDIGGVSILRSAAKSFFDVTAICDTSDYEIVKNEIIKINKTSLKTRQKLAAKIFTLTAAYDSAISKTLFNEKFPEYFINSYKKIDNLRYGENPHQQASCYIDNSQKGIIHNFKQLGGKKLSFNNIRDIDLAWKIICQFNDNELISCAIKHSTPCGVAIGKNTLISYQKLFICDPISIFGGIVAINGCIDLPTAKELNKTFLEIIIARDFEYDALEELQKKTNLRIIKINTKLTNEMQFIQISGGLLLQEEDSKFSTNFNCVTIKEPTEKQINNLIFSQKVCKYVKSNAIVIASDNRTISISGGHVNRISATKQALKDARKKFHGEIVLASDGFFPFRDIIDTAKKFNVSAIIQPGGSIKDKESIEACNEHNIPMIFTGIRHFLH